MKYRLELEFKDEKHCSNCPCRDESTNDCMAQVFESYPETIEEQMKNCPLKKVTRIEGIIERNR